MLAFLYRLFFAAMGMLLAFSANATLINITDDYTWAAAEIVGDARDFMGFEGSLFPSATFAGFSASAGAYEFIDDGVVFYSIYGSSTSATISNGFYDFESRVFAICTACFSRATARIYHSLGFVVIGGDTTMDLFIDRAYYDSVYFILYDNTLGTQLPFYTRDYISINDIALLRNHSYTLIGNIFQDSRLERFLTSSFGYRFNDPLVLADIPEPSSQNLFLLGLLGLATLYMPYSYGRESGRKGAPLT